MMQNIKKLFSLLPQYTLEQALLSASQEIQMNEENPAAIQNVILQRDDLQNGLLSTCREVSRATAVRKCHYFSLVRLAGVFK